MSSGNSTRDRLVIGAGLRGASFVFELAPTKKGAGCVGWDLPVNKSVRVVIIHLYPKILIRESIL
jgi:hypothetical protein